MIPSSKSFKRLGNGGGVRKEEGTGEKIEKEEEEKVK